MASLSTLERAVLHQTRNPLPLTEEELLVAIQRRLRLEFVKLFHRLPPGQPPLPGILPQFNSRRPLQYLLSSPAPPSFIPQRTITPVKERGTRYASAATKVTPAFKASDFGEFGFKAHAQEEHKQHLYEQHERHLADLKNLLGPLTHENDSSGDNRQDDSGCVLLCWGSSSSCRVMAVHHIGQTMDQELFWKRLQTAWYDARGRWRQKMPWYGIRSVKQVKIRLVGPDPTAKDFFLGAYKPADKDLETEKRKLRESMRTFSDYDPEADDPEFDWSEFRPCWYDHKRGFTIHQSYDCGLLEYSSDPYQGFPDPTCHVEEHYKNRERLTKLKMEPLRSLLFQNPKMAAYNELENAELVYTSKTIRGQYQLRHRASLGQIVFRGLYIEDGWTFDATVPAIFMPLAAVASILIVLVARLIYRDWGVAWNVGACFVPLLTGLGSWLFHAGTSG